MTKFEQYHGLIAAPFTPMDAGGELDLPRVAPLAEALQRAGVRGAFVGGTTGECLSLTVPERMALAEVWRDAAVEDFAVLVHVGHNCLADAEALAAHAAKIGADGIGAFGPSYHRPVSPDGLVAFCAQIAAAGPELPFYYYHIPSMTRLAGSLHEFLTRAADRIPTLAGAKFTHEDLADFARCLRLEDGRYNLLFGRDEMLLSALAIGARGAVGTTYTFAAPLYVEIIQAFNRGDLAAAAAAQTRAAEMIAVFNEFGGLPAGKAMMEMIGLDCGPLRLPLIDLSADRRVELRSRLEAMGFFDYCVKA